MKTNFKVFKHIKRNHRNTSLTFKEFLVAEIFLTPRVATDNAFHNMPTNFLNRMRICS